MRAVSGMAALAAACALAAVSAQGTRTVWDGVYTKAQAARGAAAYDAECGSCHGEGGAGGSMAPPLAGPSFSANYDGQTVAELFERNRATMPVGKEGQLERPLIADITAFMLQCNGFPAGSTDLPSETAALRQIRYLAVRPADVHQDDTSGREWIQRLERANRLPGLRVEAVIAALGLRPGHVVADIGAGTGAFTIPFARAVGPAGRALAVDIWPELLEYIGARAAREHVGNVQTILAARDDPRLPAGEVDLAFFHDVFHNVNDREGYLRRLASLLKPGGRIAIVEQEFDDPIAQRWDRPEDRITREQVSGWMKSIGFALAAEFDLFQGANNPPGTGMPERWFVVYARQGPP